MKKLVFSALFTVLFFIVFAVIPAPAAEPVPPEDAETEEEEERDPSDVNAIDELMKSIIGGRSFDGTAYGLEGDYTVLQETTGILETGGDACRVRLVALRKEDGIYDRALLLEIIPADGGPSFPFHFPQDVKGFDSRIDLKNFVSRDKSEVLLTVQNGRGGVERFLIVEIESGQGNVLYDSQTFQIPSVRGRFLSRFRAEVFVEETGTWSLIDLSARRARYVRNLVYLDSSEELRSPITLWRSRSELQPADVDGDGIYELKGVIELSGAGRADRIAYVETTLKYQDGQWRAFDCWVTPVEDLANKPIPRRIQ